MDLDFLALIVAADDRCQLPPAEVALRLLMGDPREAGKVHKSSKAPYRGGRQKSDPDGLLRSIRSGYAMSGGYWRHRRGHHVMGEFR